jgi:glucose-6-phosphate 1-epimerase
VTTPAELSSRFKVSGMSFDTGSGGLNRIVIDTGEAQAHIYLHGAHVTHYQPHGFEPVLLLSNRSFFQAGKPIRGGAPVIFPWFGPRDGYPDHPMHGFVRLKEWNVDSISQNGKHVEVALSTAADDATRAVWPHEFLLKHVIRVGRTLEMSLIVENKGTESFLFEEALHTYYSVSDVLQTNITGLQGVTYLDKNQNMAVVTQTEDQIVINGKNDRVYLNTQGACVLTDPRGRRKITVAKEQSNSTVVWCPWQMTPAGMADLGEGQWQRMVCIETCNVKLNSVTLPPGKIHAMKAIISTERIELDPNFT